MVVNLCQSISMHIKMVSQKNPVRTMFPKILRNNLVLIFKNAWIAQVLLQQAQQFPQVLAGQFKTTLAGLFLNMVQFQELIR